LNRSSANNSNPRPETVVAGFDFSEPRLIDAGDGKLLIERDEAQQMVFDAAPGIFRAGFWRGG